MLQTLTSVLANPVRTAAFAMMESIVTVVDVKLVFWELTVKSVGINFTRHIMTLSTQVLIVIAVDVKLVSWELTVKPVGINMTKLFNW